MITIRGTTYATHKDASDALGVSVSNINKMARLGRADMIGLGRGAATKKPVTVNGKSFDSVADAARHFDIPASTLSKEISSGATDNIERRSQGHPVTIKGQQFPSLRSAARHFDVPLSALISAVRSGDFENMKRRSKNKPITINGVSYPSQSAAERAIGLRRGKFTYLKRKHNLNA